MDLHQRMLCVKSLGMYAKDMANLSFPAYGSIYFENSPTLSGLLTIKLGESFCLGPNCTPAFWDFSAGETKTDGKGVLNRGPCKTYQVDCE